MSGGYISSRINSECRYAQLNVRCARVSTETAWPKTSDRTSSSSFGLLLIPVSRVPRRHVFFSVLVFTQKCDAHAVSRVVTRLSAFSTVGSVLSPRLTLELSRSCALTAFVRTFALAFLAFFLYFQFCCPCQTKGFPSRFQVSPQM